MTKLSINQKIEIIKQVGEELINEDELRKLLEKKEHLIAYDGFEPSGQIHIAQGLLRAINVNKLTSCGIKFKFWIADYFAMLNNKYGGDLEKIKIAGEYAIEIWKSCGMNLENVEFIWAKEFYEKNPEYWETVLKLSTNASISRVLRCGQIMGRGESTNNPSAQILYPLMQAADIYHLNADIAQLGLDQRKVNMLVRDIFPKLGFKKPIAIHHHMLLGLQFDEKNELEFSDNVEENFVFSDKILFFKIKKIDFKSKIIKIEYKNLLNVDNELKISEAKFNAVNIYNCKHDNFNYKSHIKINGIKNNKVILEISRNLNPTDRKIAMKMSKSKPDTAIFMTDTIKDVQKKFNKAHCVDGIVEDNPVLEYAKYIVFEKMVKLFIGRPEKYGGNLEFNSYDEVEKAFIKGTLKSIDLKQGVASAINDLLEPTRKHFESNKKAKELLEKVQSFIVTR